MQVKDLMTKDVVTANREMSVAKAAQIMAEKNVGLLVVLDTTEQNVIGVMSDSDIISKVVARNLMSRQVMVNEIMNTEVIDISPEKTVSEAANMMRNHKIKRLPVIENNKLVGIISSTDIIRSIVEMKKALLNMALEF